jgi:hypothetical protein
MFYILFAVALCSRFLPHPPNVAAIGALGLFAGCYLNRRWAFAIPVAAMFASDTLGQWLGIPGMGYYSPISMGFVYSGFIAAALIGRRLQNNVTVGGVVGYSLVGSTLFFLISNFGVWLSGSMHGHSTSLLYCYWVAIPFYGATIAGDLLYAATMFGAMAFAAHGFPQSLVPWQRDSMAPLVVRR